MVNENEIPQNKLIRIDWEKLENNQDTDGGEHEVVTKALRESLTDGSEYTPEHQALVANFIVDSISELKRVLSIEKKIDVKIRKAQIPLKQDKTIATFQARENGEFVIEFSGSVLQICLASLRLIESFSQSIQEAGDDQESKKIFQEVIDKEAAELSELLQIIGHEMYHARQAAQHRLYYLRTAAANTISIMIRVGLLKKDEAQQSLKKDPYTGDIGEKSAEAFGIRYVHEKVKAIQSKQDKSPLEKILLLGEQKTISTKTEELAARSKQTGWE